MKILKLLQELYLELRTFNENVEYFSCLEKEKRLKQINPMRTMTEDEKIYLKRWINKCIKEKNINLDDLPTDQWVSKNVKDFLDSRTLCGTERARKIISTVLDYKSFEDLVEDWKRKDTVKVKFLGTIGSAECERQLSKAIAAKEGNAASVNGIRQEKDKAAAAKAERKAV